ncbi:AT-rich interactive domain-containing protein 5B isoform X2 [Aplysia californica]|uniref:AT-rich interactive domain-containing protein 5B isoform X2 n=1 Tax=Aplysia californica TaxID=6500 RepID=A0ABM0JN14_APLCA|nr:AT-rich interactive domain-containing protein 5B isoform X2 [Aplysia californica]
MHALPCEWDALGSQVDFKMSFFQFQGPPCLQHTNYLFYNAFKYSCDGKFSVLSVGDFFFLKILQEIPVCIGEIELLWEDKASNQLLSSLRLYFRPEHTPDGRHDDTGEDEVVVLGERIVLRLDDLVPLIQEDFKWTYGNAAFCKSKSGSGTVAVKEEPGSKALKNGDVARAIKPEVTDNGTAEKVPLGAANVAVMSYPKYCRYRAVMRRLEGCENEWLHVAVVLAIGGYAAKAPGCRVMFCKDSFYHSDIDDLDIRMDHMLPVLKARNKGKKSKSISRKDSQHDSDSMEELFANITPSISTSSRPRRSTDTGDLNEDKVSTEEQAFLFGLHKFMHDAKMPIGRIPSLGFKQNLYYFYKQAEKLGGYDMITTKRMWKHLYDKLGGNSSNTSAATCTRRHYERLLLPYERHLRKGGKPKRKHKHIEKQRGDQSAGKEISDSSSHKENVENKDEVEVKKENVESAEVDSKVDIKRKTFNENVTNVDEAALRKDKLPSGSAEHSSEVHQGGGLEPLEVPSVKQRPPGSKSAPFEDKASFNDHDSQSHLPGPSDQARERHADSHHLKPSSSNSLAAPAPSPLASISAESPVIPYTNLMYRGGYLLPVLPPHMLSPWGVLPPHGSASTSHPGGEESLRSPSVKDSISPIAHSTPIGRPSKIDQTAAANSTGSAAARGLEVSGGPSLAPRSSTSAHSKAPINAHTHQQLPAASGTLKAAHSNTPYEPSPYLLQDHIQPARGAPPSALSSASPAYRAQSSRYPHSNDLLGHTSHSLAPIMHPTPPGHKSELCLPPAPASLYLDPRSNNPFSPLPVPISGNPSAAHNQPRKRTYPFDNLNVTPASSVFPSPDMVLNRIKSSAGLPRSNATATKSFSVRQQFDCPRDIFRQTPQTFAANQNSQPSQSRKQSQHIIPEEASNSRNSNQKSSSSKSSSSSQAKRNSQLFSPYGSISSGQSMAALELQKSLLHQPLAPGSSNSSALSPHTSNNKLVDPMKLAGSSNSHNGMLQLPQQVSKGMLSSQQAAALQSSGKDGRLTSALFGAQFTAMPRSTKASDQIPGSVSMEASSAAAAAAAASMGLNPHLHPAFMSPYLPAASPNSATAAAALNPQLQMLAGAYGASPVQLAAYEELLRQNGYGAFLPGVGPPPAKAAKKN